MWHFITFSLVLLFSVSYSETEYDGCINPSSAQGYCIPLLKCASLLRVLKEQPIQTPRIQFLQASTCAFIRDDPWVCCTSADDLEKLGLHQSGGITTTTRPQLLTTTPLPVPPFAPEEHSNWKLLPKNKSCGTAPSQVVDRIVGGSAAGLGTYPWMALLAFTDPSGDTQLACGGTLISRSYILTAAHCVSNLPGGFFIDFVRIGEYDQKQDPDCQDGICAPKFKDYKVEEAIVHESYNSPMQFDNDIALLRLQQKIILGPFVQPICLPQGEMKEIGVEEEGKAIIAGWGRTISKDSDLSPVLLHISVPILPMKTCLQAYNFQKSLKQICAGGQSNIDSCKGDSGGPLMKAIFNEISKMEQTYQLGIVSFGQFPCGNGKPAVYTKVSEHMIWILDHIRP